jgi:alpha-glucosidase
LSEYDLIKAAPEDPGSVPPITCKTAIGNAGVPVLQVNVNPSEQPLPWPSAAEIPGLLSLRESSEVSPFLLREDGEASFLSWRGLPLLESRQKTRLVPIKLDSMPGLKTVSGDTLPKGFGQALTGSWVLSEDQRVYGLGQRATSLERRGTSAVNWATDEPSGHVRSTDPLYQAHPLVWGRTGSVWWAVFFLHTPYTRFDLAQETHDRLSWLSNGESLEYQIHAARSPAELHASLRQCWQPPTAPPLWALGFHQSRWGYRSGRDVLQLVDEFVSREIPLDVIHLDIDHMEDYRSFTFSKERFPEPKQMLERFAKRGVRTVCIIDPGLRFDPGNGYEPCDSGLAGHHFLKSQGGAPVVGYCWPDEALFPDFYRQATRKWWAEHAAFYLDHAVSGLWIDMNEPAIFDKPFWTGGSQAKPMPLETLGGEDGRKFTQAAAHNVYGSFMAQATAETWNERGGRRPWMLTRAGFTGVARYAWSWMGDNTSWWEHLSLSIPQLASMGLVGSPFVGVDIGGFFGNCTAELYSAWIETSVIYPFMRAHSALDTRIAHPWSFGPEVEQTSKTAIRFRYRLLPYLYAAAMTQAAGDVPMLRPMFFDYPQDARFELTEDQVMVGPHLMAAPLLRRGQTERAVLLPEGAWYDLISGHRYEGGRTILISRRPGLVPLFARAGSAIPMLAEDHQVTCTDGLPGVPWNVHLFPGADGVPSTLYWDEGEGWEFHGGQFARLGLALQGEQPVVKLREGRFASAPLPALSTLLPGPDGWRSGPELCWREPTAD